MPQKTKAGRLRAHAAGYKYEWILFFCFFLFNAAIALQFKAPVSYPDEYGVLMSANHFYGGEDWLGCAYYGYSSSPLIGWLFLIFEDVQQIYVGILMIKSLLIALVPIFCYKLLNEVLKVEKASVKFLLSAAIGLYPSLVIYSKRACNETMLHLTLFICFYLIGKCAICDDKWKLRIYSVFLGFFPVVAYATHGMGLAFIVAVFMIVLVSHIMSKKKLVSYPAFLASFVVSFLLDSKIKAYLMEFVFQRDEDDLKNTFMYSLRRMLTTALNTKGLKTFVKAVVSKIHYMSTATFGLFLLLSVILLVFIFWFFKNRFLLKRDLRKAFRPTALESAELALALFGFLIVVCGVGLSTLNHIAVIQSRHGIYYFYGRYYEYMVLPLILFGLYYVMTKKIELKKLLISAGISVGGYVTMAVFVQRYVVPHVTQKGAVTRRHMIYGVLPYIGSTVEELMESGNSKIVEYSMIAMGIACIGGLIVTVLLLSRKLYKPLLVLLAAFFIYGSVFGLVSSALPKTYMNDKNYYSLMELMVDDFHELDELYEQFPEVYVLNNNTLGGVRRIQIAFNRYSISGDLTLKEWKKADENKKLNNAIIVSNEDFKLEDINSAYLKILNTKDTTVWICGNEIQDYWGNWQSKKPS